MTGLPRGCLCVSVHVCVCMGHHAYFPTLVLSAQRIAETKSAHIWALPCQELLVSLNVLTIICLSLSLPAFYSLSCSYSMASSHYLPLHPSLSLSSAPFLPRGLCLLTLTKLKGLSLGQAWATWKQQKQIPLTSPPLHGSSPVASCSIVWCAPHLS